MVAVSSAKKPAAATMTSVFSSVGHSQGWPSTSPKADRSSWPSGMKTRTSIVMAG